MAINNSMLAKIMGGMRRSGTPGANNASGMIRGRTSAKPGRSFASSTGKTGTPGSKNPTAGVRRRTTSQGKSVVPKKAKTPKKVKQGNPKGRRSVKSTPVGYKNAKMRKLKGGLKDTQASKFRGGYGAARPNFGKTASRRPNKAIGGR